MFTPPAVAMRPPDMRIERLVAPTVEAYRRLYNGVGRAYHWTDRNRMGDDELRDIIQNEAVEIDVLYVKNEPAGYVELDCRVAGEVQIAYFGLFPAYVGQGMGRSFLAWALDRAWSFQPRRVCVHTCDLDHPMALRNYLLAGFAIYDEKLIEQVLADD